MPAEPQVAGAGESLEDRKKRLQAQRAALLEKRKQEREKELQDYNQSVSGAHLDAARNSFYAQMIKMDQALPKSHRQPPSASDSTGANQAAAQQPAANAKPAASGGGFNLDDLDPVDL